MVGREVPRGPLNIIISRYVFRTPAMGSGIGKRLRLTTSFNDQTHVPRPFRAHRRTRLAPAAPPAPRPAHACQWPYLRLRLHQTHSSAVSAGGAITRPDSALPPESPYHRCHDQAPLQDQQVAGPMQRPRKASARQRHPHHGLLLRVLQTPPQVPERTEGMVLPFIPPRCLELFAPGLIEHKPELVRGLVDGLVAFLRCKFFTDQ